MVEAKLLRTYNTEREDRERALPPHTTSQMKTSGGPAAERAAFQLQLCIIISFVRPLNLICPLHTMLNFLILFPACIFITNVCVVGCLMFVMLLLLLYHISFLLLQKQWPLLLILPPGEETSN